MPRYAAVAPHLPVTTLADRDRRARDPVERTRWHLLWLVADGRRLPEAAALVGYSSGWARAVVRRYHATGPAGIVDGRHANPGATPLPSPALREGLRGALGGPPPDGGLWTCAKVAARMGDRLGRPVAEARGREALRALGWPPPAPPAPRRRRRPGGPSGLQTGGLQARVDAVRAAHPAAPVTVWAEDEHRLGLPPIVRRVWAPRGRRPTAWVRRRYQGLYVYAFVRPTTGHSWWCLLPSVSTAAMSAALAAFVADGGIDADHRAVVVLDGAGWHASSELQVPDGVDLVPLPPTSPDLQPVERLWPLLNEPVANRTFLDLTELERVLIARCRTLRANKRAIKAHTRFHWWSRERRPRSHASSPEVRITPRPPFPPLRQGKGENAAPLPETPLPDAPLHRGGEGVGGEVFSPNAEPRLSGYSVTVTVPTMSGWISQA